VHSGETTLIGEKIGHIEIVDQLGEGGMGAVYVGFDEKLQRQVAVKAIRGKSRLDDEAKARFLREARILSQLEHPRICTVHDFIESDDGDFLVLELLRGETLRQAMRGDLGHGTKLAVAQQLLDVLETVHAKGVIHRDLKPENVMLLPDGEIKVLDFGLSRSKEVSTRVAYANAVAKAEKAGADIDPDETLAAPSENTSDDVRTRLGSLVGTIAYMSPEQARGEPATSASDMYSAGLMLQELFTEKAPYEDGLGPNELLAHAADGKIRPVTGLPADLSQLIERLTALAPGARPSAQDAAELLQKIIDRPTLRRRRWIVGSAVAVVILLLAGIAVRERVNARRVAVERDTAQRVSDFLTDLFEVSDPFEAQGKEISVRELLDRGAERIETELVGQPLVRARLMTTLGVVYQRLGHFDEAEKLLVAAVEIRRRMLGNLHTDTLTALDDLAGVYHAAGKFDDAEAYYRESLAGYRRALGDDHPSSLIEAGNLGMLLVRRGKLQEAEPYCREAADGLVRVLDADDPNAIIPLSNMGYLLHRLGRYEEAELYWRQALSRTRRTHGADHSTTLLVIGGYGYLLKELGKLDEAEPLYREALEGRRRIFGDDHPTTLESIHNMGYLLKSQGKLDEAEVFYREAIEGRRCILGDNHKDTLLSINNLGVLLRVMKRHEESEVLLLGALDGVRRVVGEDSPSTLRIINNLGVLYREMGEYDKADTYSLQALEGRRRVFGEFHPTTLVSLFNLGKLRRAQGRLDEADACFRESLAGVRRVHGDHHPNTRRGVEVLIELSEQRSRSNEAEQWRKLLREIDAASSQG
jgi:tetratricopeptide (TPR) repeat protein/tRNA A-37 threonylcarbamoyl transferase component Bud32